MTLLSTISKTFIRFKRKFVYLLSVIFVNYCELLKLFLTIQLQLFCKRKICLRKFMEVSDLSVENLHACVAKSMKLRTSGIDECDSLERLDYRALIKATSDKLKEGSRRELIERRTRKLIIEIIKHCVRCYYLLFVYVYCNTLITITRLVVWCQQVEVWQKQLRVKTYYQADYDNRRDNSTRAKRCYNLFTSSRSVKKCPRKDVMELV